MALEPIRQGARERFGAFAKGIAGGLALRHDHGSQCVSHHFRDPLPRPRKLAGFRAGT